MSTSSQQTDREYANTANLLRRQRDGAPSDQLTEPEKIALRSFTEEVNEALPVGDSEVQRVVQDAVADYLKDRPTETREGLKALSDRTRMRILDALKNF